MPGTWLTRIARRLTRDETFERLVSPAIADLQSEAAHGLLRRSRHYAGIALVIASALLRDFHGDLALAFDAHARRRVWTRVAVWTVAAGFVHWVVMYGMTLRILNRFDVAGTLASQILDRVVFQSFAPAMTVALIVAAYALKRRDTSGLRTVVAATTAVIALTLVVSEVARTFHMPARQALDQIVIARLSVRATVIQPPFPLDIPLRVAQLGSFAWLGVVLARRQGWPLAIQAAAVLGTYLLLLFSGASSRLAVALVQLVPSLDAVWNGILSVSAVLTLPASILLWQAVLSPFDKRGSPSPESSVRSA